MIHKHLSKTLVLSTALMISQQTVFATTTQDSTFYITTNAATIVKTTMLKREYGFKKGCEADSPFIDGNRQYVVVRCLSTNSQDDIQALKIWNPSHYDQGVVSYSLLYSFSYPIFKYWEEIFWSRCQTSECVSPYTAILHEDKNLHGGNFISYEEYPDYFKLNFLGHNGSRNFYAISFYADGGKMVVPIINSLHNLLIGDDNQIVSPYSSSDISTTHGVVSFLETNSNRSFKLNAEECKISAPNIVTPFYADWVTVDASGKGYCKIQEKLISIKNKYKDKNGYTSNLQIENDDKYTITYDKTMDQISVHDLSSSLIRESTKGMGFHLNTKDCSNDWPSMFKTYKDGDTCVVEAANKNTSTATEQNLKHNLNTNKPENNVPPLKSKIANFVAKFW